VVLGHLCYHGLYTFCLLLQCMELASSKLRMHGIMKNLEGSYNMTLMRIKSNSYPFLYPLTANIKDSVTKLVEHTKYSNFF
jgi:hypothetical protein